ncbi:DUF3185 family protein [Caldovatus aquaticus]|uniref:DUF3185 family protein n=1 Tax=Caldovatus aquaticus TaxID=2865671 RepID=A0ABS7F1B2_9PROT|nr:DUF3185 family protein [Caldovatus aquaticus]MBW8268762.1 DUF3185 family protein [Caldovatus aquaticus]
MPATRIAGIALLVLGAVLLVTGLGATDAPVERLSNALTGRYTEGTMWYLIGGVLGLVLGALLALLGRRGA